MQAPRFVVDTMLGRLAHWLRAMGYDTLDLGPADDDRLLRLALAEDRILLTRDGKLARLAGLRGCLIRADRVEHQLEETVEKLALAAGDGDWLSRCLECNARLEPREKETVRQAVPERVFGAQTEFMGCPGCGKIYWLGSHADRILARLAGLLSRERKRSTPCRS